MISLFQVNLGLENRAMVYIHTDNLWSLSSYLQFMITMFTGSYVDELDL
jgi:hypothetical protein